MAKVNLKEMLNKAREEKYAVPAFDVSDYRMIKAVLDVAEKLEAPVILMGLPGDLNDEQFDYLSKDLTGLAESASVPVCVHLDHADNFEIIKKAIDQGYSSVMIDGSPLALEDNIALVKPICDYAHQYGVSVEAELGHVGDGIVGSSTESAKGNSGHDNVYTDPEEMKRFIDETGVDCLAVSFGTSHGVYKTTPNLQIDLLKKLNEVSTVPLVVHGGSGTPDDQMKKAIENGICKVNIFSEILEAFFSTMKRQLNEMDNMALWPHAAYEKPIESMKDKIEEKFYLCNAVGKTK